MDDLININDYKTSNIFIKKKYYWFVILVLVIFSLLFSLLFINFEYYYNGVGLINNDKTIDLKLNSIDVNKLINSNKMIINNKEYKYKILNLSLPIMNENKTLYQDISINIRSSNDIRNTLVNFKVKYDTKSGFEIIKKFILGKGK